MHGRAGKEKTSVLQVFVEFVYVLLSTHYLFTYHSHTNGMILLTILSKMPLSDTYLHQCLEIDRIFQEKLYAKNSTTY